jgi:hypothetical protein
MNLDRWVEKDLNSNEDCGMRLMGREEGTGQDKSGKTA